MKAVPIFLRPAATDTLKGGCSQNVEIILNETESSADTKFRL